jgi:hypothetical protein
MVKPWNEWMFILFPNRECDINIQPSRDEYMSRVRDFIGDDTPAENLDISKWFINEIIAEEYSKGNVYVPTSFRSTYIYSLDTYFESCSIACAWETQSTVTLP